ncbi:MAG: alpha-amylase family glycosyl hydrolase [Melioribacteraceae bacterium]|nr:alpha-amylase family glycosyl hydrolase [Melioribacteraceae bacterium]
MIKIKYEFHIAKEIRKKYDISDELFSLNGNVVFANFIAVRNFVKKINDKRNIEEHVSPGLVNAFGLIDEIYHYIFRIYETQINPGVFEKALNKLNNDLGIEKVRKLFFDFCSVFPPLNVYKGKEELYDYLNSYTDERANTLITLEEIILLYFANINPSNKKIVELFNENYLGHKEIYNESIKILEEFFKNEKKVSPLNQDIFTLLKLPIITNPEDIEAQLEFIKEKFGILISDKFLKRILTSKDLFKEEFVLEHTGFGGAPSVAPDYKGESELEFLTLGKSGYKYAQDAWKDFIEPENFTKDIDWMPNVVLIAKNSYVWLDQLSKKYGREIKTLNQIPDEELDQLAKWNFNGLWLIGIWERSSASKKIKHIMGNIDAVSSAYSLYDYQIAKDLGGEEAYNNLNHRCKIRGIRLASDMVPNHTGIFSDWVIKYPNYFIQTNQSPFPNYTFSGPDLSDDPSVQIRIEDGYYRKSDAAVVFQRIDNRTGEVRYIYHGNDGTNMPWNDTAQLNMLEKEVREAVIQKIFDVAKKFSIIRFDAAMTLTKKHFSRLWYPEPGKGGDIPSRADFSMTKEEFDNKFPIEFWREVVDRINQEMPETLLLAEAFWLLEGYFVRSLGMHRVYNSAFMHMMMKEENNKYRYLISETLEFEPEILKRYVNFMSNPDEETAIKQFGSDDKYFGVCTLMVTLPGLPMFAHGQIEGYTEKYGMEYQRAYYNEFPNQWLIERHQKEIFPLMKKRYLFSHVSNFWFYDFVDEYGNINENVFAFTNYENNERAIIFYNNKFQEAKGKILWSTKKLISKEGENKITESRKINDCLKINSADNCYYIYREHVSNQQFILKATDLISNGFSIYLGAFKYKVFIDFQEVFDSNGDFYNLYKRLNGKGVKNIYEELEEMKLEPIHNSYLKLFSYESINSFIEAIVINKHDVDLEKRSLNFIDNEFLEFLTIVKNYFNASYNPYDIIKSFEKSILSIRRINLLLEEEIEIKSNIKLKQLPKSLVVSKEANYHENSILYLIWLTLLNLRNNLPTEGLINKENYLNKLNLTKPVRNILSHFGRGEQDIYLEINLLNVLLNYGTKALDFEEKFNEKIIAKRLLNVLEDDTTQKFIGVNVYQNVTYFSKENFEELLNWFFTIRVSEFIEKDKEELAVLEFMNNYYKTIIEIKKIASQSAYKFELLKEYLNLKAAE